MKLFGVGLDGVFVVLLLGREVVAVAKLEEAYVGVLAVHVAADALQSAEEEGLAHHAQVGAQRVHELHGVLLGIFVEALLIVGCLGERVVHDLAEAASDELLADDVLKMIFVVFVAKDGE